MSDNPKILIISAAANMIQQFNRRNILILKDLGYEVHVATNFINYGSMSFDENEKLKKWLTEQDVVMHQIDFMRGLGTLKVNWIAYKRLRAIIRENEIGVIHAHSPIGGVIGRLAAKREHIKTIYTAHGFHFFKGAPVKNWILFYPIEWVLSFITDLLIVINKEDERIAKKYFHARKNFYIPGIGIDVKKQLMVSEKEKLILGNKVREELNIPKKAFLILSIGELSDRKNHQIVLKAIRNISKTDIYYIIAGTGPNEKLLESLADDYGIKDHFRLLGYRNDIHELNYAADINVFPSLREGLGLGGLGSVIDGTYLIGSNTNGIKDYIVNDQLGLLFSPDDSRLLRKIISNIYENRRRVDLDNNKQHLLQFDMRHIDNIMHKIYELFY